MKKYLTMLTALLLLIGVAVPAQALQYSYGNATVVLDGIDYSYEGSLSLRRAGFVSAGVAMAADQDEFDVDTYYTGMFGHWAEAATSSSWASTGLIYEDGHMLLKSSAEANAGGAYGPNSGAFGGNFAAVYNVSVFAPTTLSISVPYSLLAEIDGDGLGYSLAGAAALLGLYSDTQIVGDWLGLEGAEDDFASESGFLSYDFLLDPGTAYKLFIGTAAYAYASEPAAVPEPATMMLLGLGLLGLAGLGGRGLIKRK